MSDRKAPLAAHEMLDALWSMRWTSDTPVTLGGGVFMGNTISGGTKIWRDGLYYDVELRRGTVDGTVVWWRMEREHQRPWSSATQIDSPT